MKAAPATGIMNGSGRQLLAAAGFTVDRKTSDPGKGRVSTSWRIVRRLALGPISAARACGAVFLSYGFR